MEQNSNFWDHLEVLRRKIIWTLVFFLGAMVLAFIFIEPIVNLLKAPLFRLPVELAYLKPQEKLLVYLKTSFIAGFCISIPFFLCQLGSFVFPALYPKEKRLFVIVLCLVFLSFAAGCLFSYFFLGPFFFNFLVNFSQGDGIKAIWSIGEYFHLFFLILMMMGLVFQTPWVLLILIRMGILQVNTLKKYRRHIIIVIFIIAAIITPPDVYSQSIVGIILYLLFELTLIGAKFLKTGDSNRQK